MKSIPYAFDRSIAAGQSSKSVDILNNGVLKKAHFSHHLERRSDHQGADIVVVSIIASKQATPLMHIIAQRLLMLVMLPMYT
jgi:hypothetical protein